MSPSKPDMDLASQTGPNSNKLVEEPADILNVLALHPGQNSFFVGMMSASEGQRYPMRKRRKLEQDSEPIRTSASITGKLKRPSKSHVRDVGGNGGGGNATNNLGAEAELHASAVATKSHNTKGRSSGRAEAENSTSVRSKKSALCDINTQDAKSSMLQEEPDEHAENPELFGQESAWAAVLDGAQSVGVSVSGDESLPRLKSRTMKNLVKTSKLAERLFERLLREQHMDEVNQDKLEEQLEKALAAIYANITKLDEAATGKEASIVINDIYAHAIPNLVFMLQSALRCRTKDYGDLNDTEVLQAMISIQDIILLLCEKAASWKVRPDSETPIVRPTRQKMNPNLRDIRKAFLAELKQRERLSMHKQRERMIAEAHERQLEKKTKENEKNERKRKEKAIKIKEELDRIGTLLGLQLQERKTNRQVRGVGEQENDIPNHQDFADQWTKEQNLELIVQLQNSDSRHLPADQRYRAIANTPLLRKKLPEHIRERAVHYKSAMRQCWGNIDYVESIE